MPIRFTRRDEVFLDTSHAVALVSVRDAHHARAHRLLVDIRAAGARLVTTRAVLFETGNALGKPIYRAAFLGFLRSLEADPQVEILPITDDFFAQALALYGSRPDKDWGLVDCYSFTVMTARGMTLALTADDHFRQAGFVALLGDDA